MWHSLAQDELAELWNEATDRAAVTAAADKIDSELAIDPANKGTLVSEVSREISVSPVQVLYRVLDDDRLVQVFSVARL